MESKNRKEQEGYECLQKKYLRLKRSVIILIIYVILTIVVMLYNALC